MKKLTRITITLGNTLLIQVISIKSVFAQTATPSSESTSSTLPEAGNFTTTLLLIAFGMALLVFGTSIILKQSRDN
jgi:hypothetical protein